ncbi:RNA-directed DNA polymerase, eukaryota [Tanacetum coccineum]
MLFTNHQLGCIVLLWNHRVPKQINLILQLIFGSRFDSRLALVNDDEEDDSPVVEVLPVKPKKPSRRATKAKKNDPMEPLKEWTVEEEITCAKLGAIYNHESGSNHLDVFQKACAEYKMIYKQDFTLEHCYNILKYHQGWLDIDMPSFYNNAKGRKKSKTFETTSGSASGGFNLNNEADEAEEETQEVRPPGHDQSKAKNKSAASSRGKSSSFVILIADKFLNIKKDKWNKREEQKQYYIQLMNRELDIWKAERREAAELKREKIAIQRRTLELAERDKRDRDILFYNFLHHHELHLRTASSS